MDFSDTPEEAAYRAKARAWIAANAPEGSKAANLRKRETEELLEEGRIWQGRKADAGYAAITRPKEWGGGGGTTIEEVIFAQEEQAAGLYYGVYVVSTGLMVPTVLAYGDDATKKKLVPPTIRGDKIWTQLFSEPGAGSDLAAVRTRAVRDGDQWVVDGQKVWNSNAHVADYGLIIVRTDFDGPKHKGLTVFWVDMKAQREGMEVRQLHQISELSDFNACTFTDYRIPDSQRLGEVGDGWKVSLTTLMNERVAVGGQRGPEWHVLMDLAKSTPTARGRAIDDPAFRERLAEWYIRGEGVKLTRARVLTALSRGRQPGPEMSIGKLVAASQAQDMANEAIEMLDQFGLVDDPEISPFAGAFQQTLMLSPGFRIAAGTDEILRNIIAERVLGLPADMRLDKDVPFREIPTGARG